MFLKNIYKIKYYAVLFSFLFVYFRKVTRATLMLFPLLGIANALFAIPPNNEQITLSIYLIIHTLIPPAQVTIIVFIIHQKF